MPGNLDLTDRIFVMRNLDLAQFTYAGCTGCMVIVQFAQLGCR
jgi:hypothetical protein